MGQVEFVGVHDSAPETAARVAGRLKVKSFSTQEELLARAEAVSIVTPTSTHYELARALLKQSKHVLVEKPMTSDAVQAAELVELARQQNCVLQVGHVERFNPVFKYLQSVATEPRVVMMSGFARASSAARSANRSGRPSAER